MTTAQHTGRQSLGTGVGKGHRRTTITPADYDEINTGFLTPCWIWRGNLNPNGYASRVKVNGEPIYPYRLAWTLQNGPIPEHHKLDHLCRTRACIRPSHLEPTSHAENCRHGSRAKLTHQIADEIRASPETTRQLADQLGVTYQAVWLIRQGKTWNQ